MNKFIVADARACIACHVCEIACSLEHNTGEWPQELKPRIHVICNDNSSTVATCRHCEDAPCVASCPVAALAFRDDSVVLDQRRCIGCKSCAVACPFGAIEMVMPEQKGSAVAQKCDLCAQDENGSACVRHCPTQALQLMDSSALEVMRQQRLQRNISALEEPRPFARPRDIRFSKPPRKGASKYPAQERKANFKEIYQELDACQAGYESQRCLHCADKANCNWTCPLHNAIPTLIELVRQGKIIEAAELSNQTSSFPEICARVCPQDRLCEGACTLKNHGGSVAVGNLERYITDTALAAGWRPQRPDIARREEKVAVIGAGPAGLGCADLLNQAGVQVDVFDRHPEIGGLLTFGIPPFKLDKALLAQRRDIFSQMGVGFHLNCEVGHDVSYQQLHEEYDAIFLGMGTYKFIRSGLQHEEAPGVVQALPLLNASTRRVMGLEDDPKTPWHDLEGKNVVVLGGGDTAMDCVRTAIRSNAGSVTCAYRRDETSMPGSRKEVVNAREEGVLFEFNVQPTQIMLDEQGNVRGIELQRTQMGAAGADGRRRPEAIAGSEFILSADILVMAFGFHPHPVSWPGMERIDRDVQELIVTGAKGRLPTQTSDEKVFAGGDAVHGADLVVTAMAAGRQAARDILTMFAAK